MIIDIYFAEFIAQIQRADKTAYIPINNILHKIIIAAKIVLCLNYIIQKQKLNDSKSPQI